MIRTIPVILFAAVAAAQPEYTITEITSWSEAQLATLTGFSRFVPVNPPGSPAGFVPLEHAGLYTAGYQSFQSGGDSGVLVSDTSYTYFTPVGEYYWQNLYWDGDDWHFSNGWVRLAALLGVNTSGLAVGYSTIEGIGDSPSGYQTHAYLYGPDAAVTDLTPDATRAAATDINPSGVICGWKTLPDFTHLGFRRDAEGTTTLLGSPTEYVLPSAINAAGRVCGSLTNDTWHKSAFVCEAGTGTTQILPLPSNGPITDAAAYDLNNASVVVGSAWDIMQSYEHFAVAWHREQDGSWSAYDLNEVLLDNPVDALLERAVAVNTQGQIICSGRFDGGGDGFGGHRYLLTPTSAPPACTADLTGDGVLNFFDIADFLDLFTNHDPRADLAPPTGAWDFFDISAYLAAFSAGCP